MCIALNDLRNGVLDLTGHALVDERYRFIDCKAYIDQGLLRILETSTLPSDPVRYTAVSYVWYGLASSTSQLESDGSFTVYCGQRDDGTIREDGGPISMKIIEFACQWSSTFAAPYLWLDRLCILQTSRRDKTWQISRMYDIYKHCQECIVLPGGLQRLASVYERTTWADRAWTYQEAIVTWEFAVVLTKDSHRPAGEQHWLVDGECHWETLHQLFLEGSTLLDSSTSGELNDTTVEISSPRTDTTAQRLILGTDSSALDALRTLVEYMAWNYLAGEGEEVIDFESINQIILRGVAMRVSSRPVDMVLSIIGLVGAQRTFQWQARDFQENDRFAATLALVQILLSDCDDVNSLDADLWGSTLLDVPLWCTLEVSHPETRGLANNMIAESLPVTTSPSLSELVLLLDNTDTQFVSSSGWWVKPLENGQHGLSPEEDDPSKHATEILKGIPEQDALRVYLGLEDKVAVCHATEGSIHLCSTLDEGAGKVHRNSSKNPFVLAWGLRLGQHPHIRFYRFCVGPYVFSPTSP